MPMRPPSGSDNSTKTRSKTGQDPPSHPQSSDDDPPHERSIVRLTSTRTSAPGDPHHQVRDLLKEALIQDNTPVAAQLIRAKHFQDGMNALAQRLGPDQQGVNHEAVRYLREQIPRS